MIGAIDSYLQIVSALYLSVCLDNHFCRHIWHPEFSDKTEKFLNENPFWKTYNLIPRIKETTDTQFSNLAAQARQRGGFMFAVCILLIIYAIFEPDLSYGMPAEAFALLAFLSCVLVVNTLQIYIKFNFIAGTVALAFCSAVYSCCHHYLRTSIWDNRYNLWVTFAAICIISLPLLYQFLWHRLTNSFFMSFWENLLAQERQYYEDAKQMEINGGEIEKLQPEYNAHFANCHVNKRKTQDFQMKDLNDCFFKRLTARCIPPGLIHLLYFRISLSAQTIRDWATHCFCKKTVAPAPTHTLKDFGMPIQDVGGILPDQTDYERYYQMYINMTVPPKLKVFCQTHNLNHIAFHTYFKRRITRTIKPNCRAPHPANP